MRLVVLGAHGTWPLPGGATSGYLLQHDGFNLWVDLGTGTLANLQRHVGLLDVGAAVISHRHPDHLVDLYPFFYARLFHPERPAGLPLFAAPEVLDRVRALVSDQGAADMARVFDHRMVEPGQEFRAGPFRVRTAPMYHPVPTLGMRVEAGGKAVAYSADTGPTEELVQLARGADVLVSEATWPDPPADGPPTHLSGAQAGEHAARAGVGRLVLTHIWPTYDPSAVAERAAGRFDGPVILAEEGLVMDP
jgi:ribonuclease BN (tRNA processing enzyme)